MNKVKALVHNYIDGECQCRTKVAWDLLILPKELGDLKLLDPEVEVKTFVAKIFISKLILKASP